MPGKRRSRQELIICRAVWAARTRIAKRVFEIATHPSPPDVIARTVPGTKGPFGTGQLAAMHLADQRNYRRSHGQIMRVASSAPRFMPSFAARCARTIPIPTAGPTLPAPQPDPSGVAGACVLAPDSCRTRSPKIRKARARVRRRLRAQRSCGIRRTRRRCVRWLIKGPGSNLPWQPRSVAAACKPGRLMTRTSS